MSTNFNAITYLFTLAKVNATGQRWVNELSNFNFSIHYKSGIENVVPESLSRYPLLQECNLERYSQHLNPNEVKSAFDAVANQVGNNETWVAVVNTINTVFSDTVDSLISRRNRGNDFCPLIGGVRLLERVIFFTLCGLGRGTLKVLSF